MKCMGITKKWYDELLKEGVRMENEYFQMGAFGIEVEVDVDVVEFERVSEELGWL